MTPASLTAPFDRAFAKTLGHEGGFVNDLRDSGGATHFGITEKTARAYGYTGAMQELTLTFAKEIYRLGYWELLNLNDIDWLSPPVAQELFDTAVNCSPGFAGKSLQRSLNALNRNERDFADLDVDGLIGQVTVAALGAYMNRRGKDGERVLLRMLNCLQGAHYVDLAERRPKDEAFVFGWFLQRVQIA